MIVAQRLCVRDAGAEGSNPFTPTKLYAVFHKEISCSVKSYNWIHRLSGALLAHFPPKNAGYISRNLAAYIFIGMGVFMLGKALWDAL